MKVTKKLVQYIYTCIKDIVLIKVSPLLTPKKNISLGKEVYEGPFKKISICTTCMGRTMHLKKTYLKNIKDNINYPDIEFVLLNYGSKDDMESWAKDNLSAYIDKGIVKYYHTDQPEKFHACKAKNLAHRLAAGDILVNMDADNYAGKDFAFYVNHVFKNTTSISCQFAGKGFRFFDTCGRIALLKEQFDQVGGYNEALAPFAGEDIDLLKRLEVLDIKIKVIDIVNFLRTVKHDNKLRLKNLGNDSMDDMRQYNRNLTQKHVTEKRPKVNINGYTKYKVYKNFSTEWNEV